MEGILFTSKVKEKSMKRRILAMLLVFALVISNVPMLGKNSKNKSRIACSFTLTGTELLRQNRRSRKRQRLLSAAFLWTMTLKMANASTQVSLQNAA